MEEKQDQTMEEDQEEEMNLPELPAQFRRRSSVQGGRRQSFVLQELQRRRRTSMVPTNLIGLNNADKRQAILPVVPREDVKKKIQAIDEEMKITFPIRNAMKKDTWKNEFHEIMYRFTETKIFSGFILFIILLNTAILIAQTWQEVSVRAGTVELFLIFKYY